jgi:hypothetical protein
MLFTEPYQKILDSSQAGGTTTVECPTTSGKFSSSFTSKFSLSTPSIPDLDSFITLLHDLRKVLHQPKGSHPLKLTNGSLVQPRARHFKQNHMKTIAEVAEPFEIPERPQYYRGSWPRAKEAFLAIYHFLPGSFPVELNSQYAAD